MTWFWCSFCEVRRCRRGFRSRCRRRSSPSCAASVGATSAMYTARGTPWRTRSVARRTSLRASGLEHSCRRLCGRRSKTTGVEWHTSAQWSVPSRRQSKKWCSKPEHQEQRPSGGWQEVTQRGGQVRLCNNERSELRGKRQRTRRRGQAIDQESRMLCSWQRKKDCQYLWAV
jgi:hypothetical protein